MSASEVGRPFSWKSWAIDGYRGYVCFWALPGGGEDDEDCDGSIGGVSSPLEEGGASAWDSDDREASTPDFVSS